MRTVTYCLTPLHYLTTYGQDKVLFGTNFPQLSWQRCVQQVQAMNLPEEIQAKFLGGKRSPGLSTRLNQVAKE